MASAYNLTPERKAKLKEEVISEITKKSKTKVKIPPKAIKPISKPASQPSVVKIAAAKPDIKTNIKRADNQTNKQKDRPKKTVAQALTRKEYKKIKLEPVIYQPKNRQPKINDQNSHQPVQIGVKPKIIGRHKKVTITRSKNASSQPVSSYKPIVKNSLPTIDHLSYKEKRNFQIKNNKIFILSAISSLVLCLVLALVIDIFGIYRWAWQDKISRTVVEIIPLPAGMVDGRWISLADYFNDLAVVKKNLETASEVKATDKIEDQIFNRLVSVSLVEKELERYGQKIEPKQIDEEMKKVVEQIGSLEKAESDIKNIYGMDIATFKNNVLKPLLALEKLNQLIIVDDNLPLNQEAKKNAETALKIALEPGTDFKTLILQYTNEATGVGQAGDMGWISRGELAPQLEQALFALKDGEVYNQVVKDEVGYHIYKLETKLTDEASDQESIKVNQILITVSPKLHIKNLFDKAVIKRFI